MGDRSAGDRPVEPFDEGGGPALGHGAGMRKA